MATINPRDNMLLLDISLVMVVLGGSCSGGGVGAVVVVVEGGGRGEANHAPNNQLTQARPTYQC